MHTANRLSPVADLVLFTSLSALSLMKSKKILFVIPVVLGGLYFGSYLVCKASNILQLKGRDLNPAEPGFLPGLFAPARAINRELDLWWTQAQFNGRWSAVGDPGIKMDVRLVSFDICIVTITDPKRGIREPLFRDMRYLNRNGTIILCNEQEGYLAFPQRAEGWLMLIPPIGSTTKVKFIRFMKENLSEMHRTRLKQTMGLVPSACHAGCYRSADPPTEDLLCFAYS
jgi:hypothetical protein